MYSFIWNSFVGVTIKKNVFFKSSFSLPPETRMWSGVNGLQCSGCHKEAFLCLPALLSPSLPLSVSCSQIRMCSSHAIGQRAVNRSCTLIQVAITFIQAHAHSCPPSLHPAVFLSFLLFFFECCRRAEIFAQKNRMKNLVGMAPCVEDGSLGMSLAHREPNTQALYVAVWRVAPSLLCFSSTPQRLPFSQGLAGGKLELFCSGGFLGEAVKAVTVWAFISPEERRGKKR